MDEQLHLCYVLKSKVLSVSNNVFGIALIAFDPNDQKILFTHLAFSHFEDLTVSVDIRQPWKFIDQHIYNSIHDHKFGTYLTKNASYCYKTLLSSSDNLQRILNSINKKDMQNIEFILEDKLRSILPEKGTILQIKVETEDKETISLWLDSGKSKKAHKAITPSTTAKDTKNTIPMSITLSPMSGVLVSTLKKGNAVELKFIPENTQSRRFGRVINAFDEEGAPLPIKGIVNNVLHQDGEYVILCYVNNNTIGRAVVQGDVKIKLFKTLREENLSEELYSSHKESNLLVYFLLTLAILLCIATIFFLLIL